MENINELKAQAYDKICEIQQHQIAMDNLQKEINELSAKIRELEKISV